MGLILEPYKDVSGKSHIEFYYIGSDYIMVQFKGSAKQYVYTYISAGEHHVEKMKQLAVSGKGLTAYINQHVRDAFATIMYAQ
ncbi:hypothetical protein NVT87_05390 [Acinetobacter radioresistens]|nr:MULTISPECIES: hypothetical protein [Acinetobacter]AWV87171.1 hypothetical protein DOM24_11445 [Acinetobacter radioresistens]MCK4086988.1 hypothetical protein [Acinetobacter radioresistens]MCK4090125.1 hypothetical protein [Acinetobacter radioresistens]MCK4108152.1 hypothetical protein [Acinetobacter radioresistens]MCX0328220.1 hypothetical protein [Acinetobacter radioresistens]